MTTDMDQEVPELELFNQLVETAGIPVMACCSLVPALLWQFRPTVCTVDLLHILCGGSAFPAVSVLRVGMGGLCTVPVHHVVAIPAA